MRGLFILGVLVVGGIGAVFSYPGESQEESQSFRQCTNLLPEGRTFTFALTGTIDTTIERAEINTEFQIHESDGQGEFKEQAHAFHACLMTLLNP